MVFDSYTYFIFFILVLGLYHQINLKKQNILLLIASYIFYGFWSIKFLTLIWFSTLTDFICANYIDKSENPIIRKRLLILSIGINLGFLGIFKYYNFFIGSMLELLSVFHISPNVTLLNIVLPVGISFYTFQTMSYTIDVYQKKIKPCKRFTDFALFVTFFPQLVAGPIERAGNLIPQLTQKRVVNLTQVKQGTWLILLGLFKKVVLADNLAPIADSVFSLNHPTGSWMTLFGIYAFTFQIYCDFSGYTDIARGSAKLLGIDLMRNFKQPYLATSPQDFWRRWHISLSTWLKDYLYIPLGGNRKFPERNLMLTMLLGGLWHGAAMHFVAWGAYHGILLALHRKLKNALTRVKEFLGISSKTYTLCSIFVMFHLTCIGWVLFRVQKLSDVTIIFQNLFNNLPLSAPDAKSILTVCFLTLPLFLSHCLKERQNIHDNISSITYAWRVNIIIYVSLMLVFWSAHSELPFIYFQF